EDSSIQMGLCGAIGAHVQVDLGAGETIDGVIVNFEKQVDEHKLYSSLMCQKELITMTTTMFFLLI
ncbi:MAG: hypothetical protein VXV73_02835, partial [Actinomycetota bacterium]|nr:hypothetical protein [Actinomycetota bacterium]